MASRNNVSFKISLDESAFISGLKSVQKGLEAVAESSRQGTITHKHAADVIEGLNANLNTLASASINTARHMQRQNKVVSKASQEFNRYANMANSINQSGDKTLSPKLALLSQISDKYRELIQLAGQLTSEEKTGTPASKGSVAGIRDAKIMAARQEVDKLSDSLKKLEALQGFSKEFINNLKGSVVNGLKRVRQGTQQLAQSFGLLRNVMTQSIDSIRQITQGFLSMGRALTFFIAIPFTAFLKESIQFATEFESAMARVTKVAGFDDDEFGVPNIRGANSRALNQFIRDISAVAGSSQMQFAQWAEDLGQFGVKSVQAIEKYLPMMEMMAQGTDVAATEVAKRLGNVANAFGYAMTDTTGKTEDFVWRIINVINELENNVGASADQILTAVEASGPTLSQLGVPPHVIASWAALGIEVGLSAEEVGTGLRNLGSFMARNYEKIFDKSHNSLIEIFGTSEQMHARMRADFAGTFTEILEHYNNQEDAIKAIAELYDFLGMRAGKFSAAMLQAADGGDVASRFREIMAVAEQQWKNPISLANEYVAVQDTLAFKTQQLKNNINNLSLAVGDSLIPELIKLVQAAMPVVKALTDLFAGLDEGTKRILFFGSAIVAISGPLLFFFSQMAFGASLIMSGLIKLGGVFGTLTKVVGIFMMQLVRLNPVAWLFAGTVSRAFASVQQAGAGMATNIVNIFGGLAKMMPQWGRGIFDGLAEGIEGSAKRIAQAVQAIANIIASFFRAHSPPETGPLQHIDKWGTTLFDTYLRGFRKADFSILKEVAEVVEHILTSWIDIGKIKDDGNAQAMLLMFRTELAGLIAQFNEFGAVADSAIRELTDRFGEASDELFKLIKLNFQLKSIIEDIAGVEKRKKEVTQAYRDQVRALMTSNMTLEEQAELLGRLQRERDKDLAILDEEQDKLETRKETIQDELDLHREILKAYQDQDKIFIDMLKAIEAYLKSLEDASGGGGGGVPLDLETEFEVEGLSEVTDAMATFSAAMANLNGQALKLELTVRTVFQTIGRLLRNEAVDNMGEVILTTDGMQDRLVSFAKSGIKSISTLSNESRDYLKVVQDMADIFGKKFLLDFFNDVETAGTILDPTGVKTQALVDALKDLEDVDLTGFTDTLEGLEGGVGMGDAFTSLKKLGIEIGIIFEELSNVIEPVYKKIRAFFMALGGQEVSLDDISIDGKAIEGAQGLIDFAIELNETFKVLEERIPKILELVGQIGDNILGNLGVEISGDISGDVDAILGKVTSFLGGIASKEKPLNWLVGIWLTLEIAKVAWAKAIVPGLGKGAASLLEWLVAGGFGAGGIANGLKLIGSAVQYVIPVIVVISIIDELITGNFDKESTFLGGAFGMLDDMFVGSGLKNMFDDLFGKEDMVMIKRTVPFEGETYVSLTNLKTGEITWANEPPEEYFQSLLSQQPPIEVEIPTLASFVSEASFDVSKWVKSFRDAKDLDLGNEILQFSPPAPGKDYWGPYVSGLSEAMEESVANVDYEAFKSKISDIKITDVEGWANQLGVEVEDILNGTVTIDDIHIPAPALIMEGLGEEIIALAEQIKEGIESMLSSQSFEFTADDQQALALAIVNAIANGLNSVPLDSAIMTSLAIKIVNGLLDATKEAKEIYTALEALGQEYALTIETAFSNAFFATDAGEKIVTFTTLVSELKTASDNLGTGFSTAAESMETLLGQVGSDIWATFKDQVTTLGGSGVGSFAHAFSQAESAAGNLATFLEGEFTDRITPVVDLFNTLMKGFWDITVTIVYGKPDGSNQTGKPAYAGQMRVVGETGRELFSPPVNGHITSHSQLSNMLAQLGTSEGGGKQYNITVNGSPNIPTEKEILRQLKNAEFLYGG